MNTQEKAGWVWLNTRLDGIQILTGYIVKDDKKHFIRLVPNPYYRADQNTPFYNVYWQDPNHNRTHYKHHG